MTLLEDFDQQSGLMLEGVVNSAGNSSFNPYFGFNVGVDGEPIDQIQAFIVAKRMQEYNLSRFGRSGFFIPFVAGSYEVLNTRKDQNAEEALDKLKKADDNKAEFFKRIMDVMGINGEVIVTHDLWSKDEYWSAFVDFFSRENVTESLLTENTLGLNVSQTKIDNSYLVSELCGIVFPIKCDELTEKIGNWRAAIIYLPIEVAEAMYLARVTNANLKLGPADERTYDKFIADYMDILHITQSVDMKSSKHNPITVTPYRYIKSSKKEVRILFSDTPESIEEKLEPIHPEQYVATMHPKAGIVFNPFVEKMIYAIETARALGRNPILVDGQRLYSGRDLLEYVRTGGPVASLKKIMPATVFENVIAPFSEGKHV